MKTLINFIREHPELQQQLKKLPEDVSKEDVVQLINDHGFLLTVDDLETPEQLELSDDELTAVTGGFNNTSCACIVAGGGGGKNMDGSTFGCVCGFYGQGGDGKVSNGNCVCVLSGGGGPEA